MYEYEFTGGNPYENEDGGDVPLLEEVFTRETPILIAAKNGIIEMVDNILDLFPVAIHDEDAKKKNIVLLAVENKQAKLYNFLCSMEGTRTTMKESMFRKVDSEGNSALHLAAKLGDCIAGNALQIRWDLKWYELVKKSRPPNFFPHQNTAGKTAEGLFSESHSELVKSVSKWLTNTCQSCSVVAVLIATVAFATDATVPGGLKQDSGRPVLESEPAFNVFSIASLVALSFSVAALVMFLSILTSPHQGKYFERVLPRKLLFALTNLFISIAAIVVSFCAGHFFVLKDELRFVAYPIYVVTCLTVTFFAMAQFPLYFDLLWAFLRSVPERGYMVDGT